MAKSKIKMISSIVEARLEKSKEELQQARALFPRLPFVHNEYSQVVRSLSLNISNLKRYLDEMTFPQLSLSWNLCLDLLQLNSEYLRKYYPAQAMRRNFYSYSSLTFN